MNARTIPTPVVDKNGKSTTVHKRPEASNSGAGRAHNIRVPQAAKTVSEASAGVDRALELANQAIQRREAVLEKITLHVNGRGELDLNDPELIEVVRVSEVANEIRKSIERLRNLEVSEKDVQKYIGTAVGGSLDGIEFSDDDDANSHAQKKALRGFYMAAFLALEGVSEDDKIREDNHV